MLESSGCPRGGHRSAAPLSHSSTLESSHRLGAGQGVEVKRPLSTTTPTGILQHWDGGPGGRGEAISGGWEVCTEGGSFHKRCCLTLADSPWAASSLVVSVSPHNLPSHRLPCRLRSSLSSGLLSFTSVLLKEGIVARNGRGVGGGSRGGGGGGSEAGGLNVLVFIGSQPLVLKPFQTLAGVGQVPLPPFLQLVLSLGQP